MSKTYNIKIKASADELDELHDALKLASMEGYYSMKRLPIKNSKFINELIKMIEVYIT